MGYDIKYKDLIGFFKYVEVKSYSNGQFYITKNEKEFAQKHIGFYEIFLVGEEIYRISNVDFEDTTQFTIEGNEFIVKYKIQNELKKERIRCLEKKIRVKVLRHWYHLSKLN